MGGPAFRVAVRDGMFHASISFGYGLNEVTVKSIGLQDEPELPDSTTVIILSSPQVDRDFEQLFEPYRFHTREVPEGCVGCHTAPGPASTEVADEQYCYGCHREIQARFQGHIRDEGRACIICHRVGSNLTISSESQVHLQNPCYTCHKDKIGQFAQDYIHGPVAGGGCRVCHDPHGSRFEMSLVNPVPVLCPSCHSMEANQEKMVQHLPFANGQCSECHDPHSTNHRWVLVRSSQDLCMSCHEESGTLRFHDHPYNVKPKRQLASNLQLTDQGELECLSCHDPHATDAVHLLRTNHPVTCMGCHPDR